MEETLEYRLTDRLGVPSVPRASDYPFKKIRVSGDIEDFELLRLNEGKEAVSVGDLRGEIIGFYRERNIPITLSINCETELVRNKGEVPDLGINVTYVGRDAKITVMRLKEEFPGKYNVSQGEDYFSA